jgi:hypothetical protein
MTVDPRIRCCASVAEACSIQAGASNASQTRRPHGRI